MIASGSGAAPLINVREVSKRFIDVRRKLETEALTRTSFDVREGEFVVLLGPSGCGKTTLLNIAAGFDVPTSGELLLRGKPVSGPGPDRGVIFQAPNLFPWLSVLDNLLFGPSMRGTPTAEQRAHANELLDLTGLGSFAHHLPYEISGGMQQRVAYARVLVNNPDVVLADEPFAALDEHTRRKMQRDFEDVFLKLRTTIIFVTHSIEEAAYLADRILIMSRRPGRIKETVVVALPRPRERTNMEFLKIQAHILKLLEEEMQSAVD